MMRRALLWTLLTVIVFTCTPALLVGQFTRITSSGTLPTCVGDGGLYLKTGASSGLYWCLGGSWLGPSGSASSDVSGPGSATDNAVTRFDGTTGKIIQNSAVTLSDSGAFTLPDGVLQTFNPDGTNAGINVGSLAGDPSGVGDGDVWYNSSAGALKARIGGSSVALGAGGGGGQKVSALFSSVATGTTQIPTDDTIPQNTEGDEYMTLAITPANASSTLYIEVVASIAASASRTMTLALFQDTTANALTAVPCGVTVTNGNLQCKLDHTMTAGTTSATTFKVRIGPNAAATTTFNGNSSARLYGAIPKSSVIIEEVLP